MAFVFFSILKHKTTRKDSRGSGDIAKNAGMDFAVLNGAKTLEMTWFGNTLNTLSPYLPRVISNPLWKSLSKNFAFGASEEVNFFRTFNGPRATSIWMKVEKPILETNRVKIIENVIH